MAQLKNSEVAGAWVRCYSSATDVLMMSDSYHEMLHGGEVGDMRAGCTKAIVRRNGAAGGKVKRCCAERAGCFTYSYLCWSNRVRRYYLKIPPCLYEHCTNVSASYGDPGCCVQLPELTTGTDADRGNGVAGVRTYVLRVRIRSRLRKHRFHTERYICSKAIHDQPVYAQTAPRKSGLAGDGEMGAVSCCL